MSRIRMLAALLLMLLLGAASTPANYEARLAHAFGTRWIHQLNAPELDQRVQATPHRGPGHGAGGVGFPDAPGRRIEGDDRPRIDRDPRHHRDILETGQEHFTASRRRRQHETRNRGKDDRNPHPGQLYHHR